MSNTEKKLQAIFDENSLVRKTREHLKKMGLPERDALELPNSNQTFDDGGHFRIEIPTINSLEAVMAVIKESKKLKININRITETLGIFRHTKQTIKDMKQACEDNGTEFVMSPGPRAAYDTSATVQTPQGMRIGYRLRGQDQLVRALVDVQRAIEIGVKSFVIYDEGMLSILNNMRKEGAIPADINFKVSAHCGHGNPASLRTLWELGANSFNPVRDLQIGMIASLRQAAPIPLDVHTDNPPASGGFMRMYEAPEIARVASPVYLKTGNSAIKGHGEQTSADEAKKMVNQASVVREMMDEFASDLEQSPLNNDPQPS